MTKQIILKSPSGNTVKVSIASMQEWLDAGYRPLMTDDLKIKIVREGKKS